MRIAKISLIAPFLLALAGPALAQSTVVLSPCQDGLQGGASQTEEDMGRYLEGSWRMSANGTGFTLGTNIMGVSLRWDAGSETLRMEGQGASVALTPVRYHMTPEGDAPFDMSTEAMTPGGLSDTDLEIVSGCANPARYYWEMGSGAQRSWGGLMFIEGGIATGFMANSAGGSRGIFMTR